MQLQLAVVLHINHFRPTLVLDTMDFMTVFLCVIPMHHDGRVDFERRDNLRGKLFVGIKLTAKTMDVDPDGYKRWISRKEI